MTAPGADPELLSLLLQQTKRFFAEEVDPARIDLDSEIPRPLLEKAGELGLFALSIPEQFGGLGFSLGQVCTVMKEVGQLDRSFATTLGLHAGLGTRGLIELGAPELQEQWLPRLASGEVIAAFAATEPGAGSDLTSVRTKATMSGQSLSITGEKAYVTNAGFAGLFTVLASTPDLGGRRSQALICVPGQTEGLSLGAEEHKMGLRGSSTTSLFLDDALVPSGNMLGEPGLGAEHAHRVLEWGRTMMAAGCHGTAIAALNATLVHTHERKQFGKHLASFGATRAHLADMATRAFAMGALLEEVARAEDEARSLTLLSTAAKVFCSEGAFETCDKAIQLHGALGFVEDSGVAMLARDCRVTRIFEGANDVLLVRSGAALLTRPDVVEPRLHSSDRQLLGASAESLAHWDKVCAILGSALQTVKRERGLSAIRQQRLLQSLARAEMNLLAASACLQKTADASVNALMANGSARACLQRAEGCLNQLHDVDQDAAWDKNIVESMIDAPSSVTTRQRPHGPRRSNLCD